MRLYFKALSTTLLYLCISCNSSRDEIFKLLHSENKEDLILGAYKAGESRNKDYIQLLLNNANDERRSINIRFKGITVYESKMIALKKVFEKTPPVKITDAPDSNVIRFYIDLSRNLEY